VKGQHSGGSGIIVVSIRMRRELFFDKGKIVCANEVLEYVDVLWPWIEIKFLTDPFEWRNVNHSMAETKTRGTSVLRNGTTKWNNDEWS
jgi:hypothetical protein